MRRLRLSTLVVLLVLMPCWGALPPVPNIQNHLTDEAKKIPDAAHKALDDALGKIQEEAKVDVAAVILPMPVESLRDMGAACFKAWGIGKDWSSGLLLVVAKDGKECVIIQSGENTPLPQKLIRLIEANVVENTRIGRYEQGVRSAVGRLERNIVGLANGKKVHPFLQRDPQRARSYGLGATVVFLLALISWKIRPWR